MSPYLIVTASGCIGYREAGALNVTLSSYSANACTLRLSPADKNIKQTLEQTLNISAK